MKHAIQQAAFCLSCLLPFSASAQCFPNTTDGSSYFIVNFPISATNSISFDPDSISLNSTIATLEGNLAYANSDSKTSGRISCRSLSTSGYSGKGTGGGGVPDANNIYPTNIPGIGMQVYSGALGFTENFPYDYRDALFIGGKIVNIGSVTSKITLIKTGAIRKGGILDPAYAQEYWGNTLMFEFRFSSPVVIQPRNITCSSVIPTRTVRMGSVFVDSFTGVGSAAPTRTFNLLLNCPSSSDNVLVTLTDVTDPGNTSTTLSLTGDSAATGVGIQILRDGVVLGYGPDSDAVGNTNQWSAERTGTGQLVVALQARYVQTDASISPGSANANATFTFSYP